MAKNEQPIDFDQKPLTIADVQEQTRLYMEKITRNKIELAGVIRDKRVSQPKQKFDKQTGEPILNADGTPQFWDSYYYVTLAFEGGETSVAVEEKWFDNLFIGQRVLFEGHKGNRFGNVVDVFHNYILL